MSSSFSRLTVFAFLAAFTLSTAAVAAQKADPGTNTPDGGTRIPQCPYICSPTGVDGGQICTPVCK
jgi:hypothetical protein